MINFKINSNILYYFFPPAICLLTTIFWLLSRKYDNMGYYVSTFCIILNIIVIPIYLIIINFVIKDVAMGKKIIFSFSSSITSTTIHYLNYGITTKTLFSPDYETKLILFYEFIAPCSILAVFFVIAFICNLIKSRT